MIVIRDIPSAIERVTQLLKQVDVKTRQIMIEAKIVEVSTNAREELGIQWGGMYRSGADAWIPSAAVQLHRQQQSHQQAQE